MTAPRAAGQPVDYRCAACGKRVAVLHDMQAGTRIVRACEHVEAGVAASLTATVYSESKVSG